MSQLADAAKRVGYQDGPFAAMEWYSEQLSRIDISKAQVMVEIRCYVSVAEKPCRKLMGQVVRTRFGGLFVRTGRIFERPMMFEITNGRAAAEALWHHESRFLIDEPNLLSPWSDGDASGPSYAESVLRAHCPQHGHSSFAALQLVEAYTRATRTSAKVEVRSDPQGRPRDTRQQTTPDGDPGRSPT